jgi:hypothetical protein
MGKVFVGLNTEFLRSSDKPFEWARASCDYWLLMFIGNKAFGCVAKA